MFLFPRHSVLVPLLLKARTGKFCFESGSFGVLAMFLLCFLVISIFGAFP